MRKSSGRPRGRPTGGLLASCGPLSLLGGSFALMAGALATPRVWGLIAGALLLAVLVPLWCGRGGFPWRRMIPAGLAVASVTWSNWLLADQHSWSVAGTAGLRIGLFVVPGIVFAAFVRPAELGDHLAQRLRLPARPVVAGVVALQRFDQLGQDWADLSDARRVRGLQDWRSPIRAVTGFAEQALALLVGALRDAAQTAIAVEARGFSRPQRTGVPRTWARPAPWTRADTTLLGCCVGVAALTIAVGLPLR